MDKSTKVFVLGVLEDYAKRCVRRAEKVTPDKKATHLLNGRLALEAARSVSNTPTDQELIAAKEDANRAWDLYVKVVSKYETTVAGVLEAIRAGEANGPKD